jgi:hypothetical protein
MASAKLQPKENHQKWRSLKPVSVRIRISEA